MQVTRLGQDDRDEEIRPPEGICLNLLAGGSIRDAVPPPAVKGLVAPNEKVAAVVAEDKVIVPVAVAVIGDHAWAGGAELEIPPADQVVVGSAEDEIDAVAAEAAVVAGPAADRVVAVAAVDDVVAAVPVQDVVAPFAQDGIVTAPAAHSVVAGPGVNQVVASARVDLVVAAAAAN